MNGRIVTALAVAGALLAIALVARSGSAPSGPATRANLAYAMDEMTGTKVNLSAYAGKPLIINLWATWCGPCRLEMPQLQELADKYRDRGLSIIGVSVDDTPEQIRAAAAQDQISYPLLVGIGHDAFLGSLGYEDVLPYSVLIRADGTIVDRITGIKTTEDWERRIRELLLQ
jgi:thiol-disulfide isomerase/thioredoxin